MRIPIPKMFLSCARLGVLTLAVCLLPAIAEAQKIETPGSACSNMTGNAEFWEQSSICVSSVWQRPAYQLGPSSSQTCNSSLAGMLQWTSTAASPNNTLQYCNGSSWASIGATTSGIILGTATSATNPQATGDVTTGLFSATASTVSVATAGVEALRVTATQSLGLGTTAPAAKLDIVGSIYSRSATGTTSFDFSTANTQYTASTCGSFTLSNMQDGGTYQLIVTATPSGTCSFTHSGLTVKLPSNHGPTTAGKMTVYSFTRVGSSVFVTWIPGY